MLPDMSWAFRVTSVSLLLPVHIFMVCCGKTLHLHAACDACHHSHTSANKDDSSHEYAHRDSHGCTHSHCHHEQAPTENTKGEPQKHLPHGHDSGDCPICYQLALLGVESSIPIATFIQPFCDLVGDWFPQFNVCQIAQAHVPRGPPNYGLRSL
ncbi:hypothetical protein V22_24490 [Calycomorphotria hydatis]|uniref:DUF2946 domain-containing protein n=1 Tax=Calycomorphotria hydatis TaxID=2528027 RepID=A0A517T9Z6_9PLAN|nr:hypothetical protein V22_24490 [Calycomorphotria hydatis]